MILTLDMERRANVVARDLAWQAEHALWMGEPHRMFIIATGLYRNKTKLMGPDSKFQGLDRLIQQNPFPMESPGK